MTEKENKAVVNAEMEEAIAEAHLPEVDVYKRQKRWRVR